MTDNNDKRTRYDDIRSAPTVRDNLHESIFRSYQVLQEVKRLIALGVPASVVGELITEMEGIPLPETVKGNGVKATISFGHGNPRAAYGRAAAGYYSKVALAQKEADANREKIDISPENLERIRQQYANGWNTDVFATLEHKNSWKQAGSPIPQFAVGDVLQVRKEAQDKGGPRLGKVAKSFWGYSLRDQGTWLLCWVYRLKGLEFYTAPGSPLVQFMEKDLQKVDLATDILQNDDSAAEQDINGLADNE